MKGTQNEAQHCNVQHSSKAMVNAKHMLVLALADAGSAAAV